MGLWLDEEKVLLTSVDFKSVGFANQLFNELWYISWNDVEKELTKFERDPKLVSKLILVLFLFDPFTTLNRVFLSGLKNCRLFDLRSLKR
jgi:hypothetical protein